MSLLNELGAVAGPVAQHLVNSFREVWLGRRRPLTPPSNLSKETIAIATIEFPASMYSFAMIHSILTSFLVCAAVNPDYSTNTHLTITGNDKYAAPFRRSCALPIFHSGSSSLWGDPLHRPLFFYLILYVFVVKALIFAILTILIRLAWLVSLNVFYPIPNSRLLGILARPPAYSFQLPRPNFLYLLLDRFSVSKVYVLCLDDSLTRISCCQQRLVSVNCQQVLNKPLVERLVMTMRIPGI